MKPYMSWLMLDPELIIDFENDDETEFNVGVGYGKMVSRTMAVFVKTTFHAGGSEDNLDWAVKIGFRRMFPKKVFF